MSKKNEASTRNLISGACLLAALLLAPSSPADAQPSAEDLAERQRLAAEGAFNIPDVLTSNIAAGDVTSAIDLPPATVLTSTFTGPASARAVLSNLGVISPVRGGSFLFMSSGEVATVPEPGTDFGAAGATDDRTTLTLTLDVPPGSTRLSFTYNFLSAEFPDFIGSPFNDTFEATVTDALGTRSIVLASVNSSTFFAASSSRAGGSGFDIFTEFPSGVDLIFEGGQPDAGLTDFQSVDVPIEANGPITLTFSIEDLSDGILDSAVLIDDVSLSALEIVDANDPSFLDGDRITTNRERLAEGGQARIGGVADGLSRLLLRSSVDGPGQVEFCLVGGVAPADGGLALPGDDGRQTCVLSAVESTSAGFQAVAVYRAAENFNSGGDGALKKRSIQVEAMFTPSSGAPSASTAEIQIHRPPVVLVHGLWSSSGSWTFPLLTDPRFLVQRADYADTNGASFRTNSTVVMREIRETLAILRQRGIAATQADVAGHSMGGLLGRIWVTSQNYRRDSNFGEGDINKLITLDSPHTGSPLANAMVVALDTYNFIGSLIGLSPKDTGALEDLSKNSSAILGLQHAEVPAHALVGIGGNEFLSDVASGAGSVIRGQVGKALEVTSFFIDLADVYESNHHDLIVGRLSQEGGLPSSAVTTFKGFESLHTSNTSSASYSNRIVGLLNTPVGSSLFAEFPAVATLPPSLQKPAALFELELTRVEALQGGLVIDMPLDGTVVTSGQTVTVSLTPPVGSNLTEVLVSGPLSAQIDDQAPFDLQFEVPIEAIGDFEMTAVGKNAAGDLFASENITLSVVPPGTLQDIDLLPSEVVLFSRGDTSSLLVLGQFSDGVVRDLSDPALGTTYLSDDPSIVSVSPDGLLKAERLGITTLIARLGAFQDSITVTVVKNPDLIFADDFHTGTIDSWSSVVLP